MFFLFDLVTKFFEVQYKFQFNFFGHRIVQFLFTLCEMKFPELCCVYILRATAKHQMHTKRSHIKYCAALNRKPYARHIRCTLYIRIRIRSNTKKKLVYLSMRSSSYCLDYTEDCMLVREQQ